MTLEEERKANREKFKEVAEFVDELKKYFGEVRVISVTKNANTK